jgi:DNA-binding NarL/FixJ family response regulator
MRDYRSAGIAVTVDDGIAALARFGPDAGVADAGLADAGACHGGDGPVTSSVDVIAIRRPAPAGGSSRRSGSRKGARPDDPLGTLTPRETEVLRRIAEGQNTKKMASEMNVTTATVRTYVRNVLAKLGAHSRLEAAALASRLAPPGRDEPVGGYPVLATLTPREREILTHLTAGSGQREVATQLHMSLKTVNTHLHNLRGKLGVHSTLEAVAIARSQLGRAAAPGDRDESAC